MFDKIKDKAMKITRMVETTDITKVPHRLLLPSEFSFKIMNPFNKYRA